MWIKFGGVVLELKHIHSFLAVAKTLNFSRAALGLNLSQPALSTQIKALETSLGATLFVRNRHKVLLTPAGQSFLLDVEVLVQQITDIELRVKRVASGDVGHLRIGFVTSATLGIVPAVTLALKKRYPGVSFDLKNLSTVQQVDALRNGTLDAGFVRLPLREEGLSITTVDREHFAIVLPKTHPLARKHVAVLDLARESFIAYGERWAPSFYQSWTGLCRVAGFTPNVIQETGEMDTTIALVAAGLGVAILPEGIARRNRRIVAVKVLQREKARSEIGIAIVADRQTPLLERLIAIAEQVGQRKS